MLYLSGKIFFTLILEAIFRKNFSPEKNFSSPPPPLPPLANIFGENKKKNWEKYGKKYGKIGKNMEKVAKIWHRGNFRPKIVIFETGCGNFRPKIVIFETGCGNLP